MLDRFSQVTTKGIKLQTASHWLKQALKQKVKSLE